MLRPVALEHAILVSLSEHAGSGYELARRFDKSIGLLLERHPPADLPRAQADGRGRLGRRRGRRAGRPPGQEGLHGQRRRPRELARWIAEPTEPGTAAQRAGGEDPRRVLRRPRRVVAEVARHRDGHAERLDVYRQIEKRDFPDPAGCTGADLHQYLVLRGGIRVEEGFVDWCDEVLARARTADTGRTPDEPVPAPAAAARPGSPRCPTACYGLDAHRPRGQAEALRTELAAFYAERARGGVGLIVTGGFAPNRTGWLLPLRRQAHQRREAAQAPAITDAVHAEGGKIALQILHAGRYAYHPLACRAVARSRSPISPFRPRELTDARRRAARSRDFVALRRARARGRATTASRSWAPRATSSTSSSRRAPTSAPTTGAARYENRMRFAGRDRARARARRSAPTSSSSTGCRCSTWSPAARRWDEVVALAKADRGGRRDDHQHRHRLARGARARPSRPRCRAARSPG